jgi:hypothetical protein
VSKPVKVVIEIDLEAYRKLYPGTAGSPTQDTGLVLWALSDLHARIDRESLAPNGVWGGMVRAHRDGPVLAFWTVHAEGGEP